MSYSVSQLNSREDLRTAPFDPRFPNQNQTKYVITLFQVEVFLSCID